MRIAYGLALLGAACLFACGSSSSNSGSNGGSSSSAGSAGSSSSSAGTSSSSGGSSNGNGGSGTGIGDGGEAGTPDTTPVVSMATPHAAGGLVAGGVIAHSANFTGVFALGESPGGNGVLTSATKQLRGGVIGASQK